MQKTKVAIIAFGNIGQWVYQAAKKSPDLEISCIYVRNRINASVDLSGITIVNSLESVHADVAIITAPSRSVPEIASNLLGRGINCVDCFDVHSQIASTRSQLDKVARANNAAAITAAGWDPGTDSVIRTLFVAMAPVGMTYTDFGPGTSMGHTVCARAKEGVEDALSLTFPKGQGLHRRMVYVKLKQGYTLSDVANAIKQDPYFANDETHVLQTDDIDCLKDLGHGATITRKGSSASAPNQLFNYDMRINNPALTAQVLVSCARAVQKQTPGCYTMPEIAPLDYLYGDKDQLIKDLV